MKCKSCLHYRREWCKKVSDSPDPDMERTCRFFSQLTHGDDIRAMNDSELAEFMAEVAYGNLTPWGELFEKTFCHDCPSAEYTVEDGRKLRLHECDFEDGECPHGNDIVWWLGQPVEEGDR